MIQDNSGLAAEAKLRAYHAYHADLAVLAVFKDEPRGSCFMPAELANKHANKRPP